MGQWVLPHTTDKSHSIWLEVIKSYLSLYVCAYSQWLSCGLHLTTAPSKIDPSCCKDLWSHLLWWYLSDSGTPLLPCSWAHNMQYQPSREVPGTNMLLYSYIHVKQMNYYIHINVNVSLCSINHHALWGIGDTASIFNFKQQRRGAITFMAQSQCGHNGEQKMLYPHCESKFQLFGYLACHYTDWATLVFYDAIRNE